MFEDTSGEILKQLTRIADAMNKSGPSPWADSIKTVATFVAGLVSACIVLILQGWVSDRREQSKMRRIVYSELAESFVDLYLMVTLARNESRGPSFRLYKDLCTFVGETYMKENRAVFYQLSEGTSLTSMYSWFHMLRVGQTYPFVLLRGPLRSFSKSFREDPTLRRYFKRFANPGQFQLMESAVQQYYDSKITLEDLVGTGDREAKDVPPPEKGQQ